MKDTVDVAPDSNRVWCRETLVRGRADRSIIHRNFLHVCTLLFVFKKKSIQNKGFSSDDDDDDIDIHHDVVRLNEHMTD